MSIQVDWEDIHFIYELKFNDRTNFFLFEGLLTMFNLHLNERKYELIDTLKGSNF